MNEIVWPADLKKTKARRYVLKILTHAQKPLSAAEILQTAEKSGEKFWISTIYRILEQFAAHGMVTKAGTLGGENECYELAKVHHSHYAVCLGCHKIIPIVHCPMENHLPAVETGFQTVSHTLEIYGYCQACRNQKNQAEGKEILL